MGTRPRRIVWTSQSLRALRRIVEHVGHDSPRSAAHVLELLLETGASLATLSNRGRRVRVSDSGDVREAFVFSWRIVYEVMPDEVWIHVIMHGARELPPDVLPEP